MLGAILGDIIGSYYEDNPDEVWEQGTELKWGDYSDDTVLTIATMGKLLDDGSYEQVYRKYYRNDMNRDYGERFASWAASDDMPAYGSYGNGAAMRVSPLGFVAHDESWLKEEVKSSASVSHNHPEGVKGAMAIAFCIYWLRIGKDKEWLKEEVEKEFGYDLSTPIGVIREGYECDASAKGTVPQAIRCFLESNSLMQAIGKAVWLGGDMDTIADMAGALAEASYGIDKELAEKVLGYLPERYRITIRAFYLHLLEREI